MQLIDTHVHINFDVFQGNLNSLKQRWQEAGVVHLVHSCVEPKEFQGIQSLADKFPELSFAVGLHPLDVDKWTENSTEEILTLAKSDSRVVAIGETGLDFYKSQHGSGISRGNLGISSRQNFDLQKLVFREQLKIAKQLNLPVIIHCRDAARDLRYLLEDFWQTHGVVPGVMHCWGGNEIETQWFLDLGFYVSFSGILTFKNARQVKASATIVPDNRLLIETDCPFLAPVPCRGKTNEPSYVRYVAQYLAQLRGVSLETIAQQTTANACHLFKLDSSRFLPNQQFSENFNNTLN